jgi:hypothetical protein
MVEKSKVEEFNSTSQRVESRMLKSLIEPSTLQFVKPFEELKVES